MCVFIIRWYKGRQLPLRRHIAVWANEMLVALLQNFVKDLPDNCVARFGLCFILQSMILRGLATPHGMLIGVRSIRRCATPLGQFGFSSNTIALSAVRLLRLYIFGIIFVVGTLHKFCNLKRAYLFC